VIKVLLPVYEWVVVAGSAARGLVGLVGALQLEGQMVFTDAIAVGTAGLSSAIASIA
jgi:hypothetical protein